MTLQKPAQSKQNTWMTMQIPDKNLPSPAGEVPTPCAGECASQLVRHPFSAGPAAFLEHSDQGWLIHHAGRHRENNLGEFRFREQRHPVVHQQKGDRRIRPHPPVPVDKCVILAKVKELCGPDRGNGRVQELAAKSRLRRGNRRLQARRVAKPAGTAIALNLLAVDLQHLLQRQEQRKEGQHLWTPGFRSLLGQLLERFTVILMRPLLGGFEFLQPLGRLCPCNDQLLPVRTAADPPDGHIPLT